VALLSFWSLVVWGSLLLLSAGWTSLNEGFGVALGRLLPAQGASLLAWLNALSAALALVVWLAAGFALAWARRGAAPGDERPGTPRDEQPPGEA
jgi:hypothetical protein